MYLQHCGGLGIIFLSGLNQDNQSTAVERMRIANNGNVGIGTNSPGDKLHIKDGNLRIENSGSNSLDSKIIFAETGYNDIFFIATDLQNVGASDQHLRFGYTNSGDSGIINENTLFNISGNGNIGIGTITPSKKLDVNGDVNISGTLTTTNLDVTGTTTTINTTNYSTENLEIINTQSDGPSLSILQNNNLNNIIDTSNLSTDKKFIVDKDGLVGINMIPTTELDVNGNIKFSGNINNVSSQSLNYIQNLDEDIITKISETSNLLDNKSSNFTNTIYNELNNKIDNINVDESTFILDGSQIISGFVNATSIPIDNSSLYIDNGLLKVNPNNDNTELNTFIGKYEKTEEYIETIDTVLNSVTTVDNRIFYETTTLTSNITITNTAPKFFTSQTIYPRDIYNRTVNYTSTTNQWIEGIYTIITNSSDGVFNNNYDTYGSHKVFSHNLTEFYKSTNVFDATGNYTGSNNFKGTIGLSISIDIGKLIYLRTLKLFPNSSTYNTAMPNNFKIYASNDVNCWGDNSHSSWNLLHNNVGLLQYKPNEFTIFGNFNNLQTKYRFFTLVVTTINGNNTYLELNELSIIGVDDITNQPITIDNETNTYAIKLEYEEVVSETYSEVTIDGTQVSNYSSTNNLTVYNDSTNVSLTFNTESIVYDEFDNFTTIAEWQLYAESLGGSTYFNNFYPEGPFYSSTGIGYITFPLPNEYNYIVVEFDKTFSGGRIQVLLNNTAVQTTATGVVNNVIYTGVYSANTTFKFQEIDSGVLPKNLKITLINKKEYTINFSDAINAKVNYNDQLLDTQYTLINGNFDTTNRIVNTIIKKTSDNSIVYEEETLSLILGYLKTKFKQEYNILPPYLNLDLDYLYAYYTFENDFNDSKNSYNLINNNNCVINYDNRLYDNCALYLNVNANANIQFPDNIHLYNIWNNGDGLTISFWFNMLETTQTYGRMLEFAYQTVKYNTESTHRLGIMKNIDDNNSIQIYWKDSNINKGVTIQLQNSYNNWNHLSFSIDKSGFWYIYLNGKLQSIDATPFQPPNITYNVKVIGRSSYSTTENFHGYIDDLRFYSKVLDQKEVKILYESIYQTIYTSIFSDIIFADIVLVAGGGSGGGSTGGGGGAGGILYTEKNYIPINNYIFRIGKGGDSVLSDASHNNQDRGIDGINTIAMDTVVFGGGGGGGSKDGAGNPGGSGGGGAFETAFGGSIMTPQYGYVIINGKYYGNVGVSTKNSQISGDGGGGIFNYTINSVSEYYGGAGKGRDSVLNTTTTFDNSTTLGGGGGGGGWLSNTYSGKGGNGIVIIKYYLDKNETQEYSIETNDDYKVLSGDKVLLNSTLVRRVYNTGDKYFTIYNVEETDIETNIGTITTFVKLNNILKFNVTNTIAEQVVYYSNAQNYTKVVIPRNDIYKININAIFNLEFASEFCKFYIKLERLGYEPRYIREFYLPPISEYSNNDSSTLDVTVDLELLVNDVITFESNYKLSEYKDSFLTITSTNKTIIDGTLIQNIYNTSANEAFTFESPLNKLGNTITLDQSQLTFNINFAQPLINNNNTVSVQPNYYANYTHNHDASDIVSGQLFLDRIPDLTSRHYSNIVIDDKLSLINTNVSNITTYDNSVIKLNYQSLRYPKKVEINYLTESQQPSPSGNILTELYPHTFVNSYLKIWYKFDNNLLDSTGNSYLERIHTNDLYTVGQINNGISLNNSTYQINNDVFANILDDNEFTIATYFKNDFMTLTEDTILSRYSNTSNTSGIKIYLDDNNQLSFERKVTGDIWKKVITNAILTINQWYHVVFYCAIGILKIYINGTLDAEILFSETFNNNLSTKLIGIGTSSIDGVANTTFKGYNYLDDFRVYNKALTVSEINLLSQSNLSQEVTHKILTFEYIDTNLVYDFTPYNDLASWEAYVEQIGGEHYLNSMNYTYNGTAYYGVFMMATTVGYVRIPLPSEYNKVKVTFKNGGWQGSVRLYIAQYDTLVAGTSYLLSIGTGVTDTSTWNYNPGDWLQLTEHATMIGPDLKLEFEGEQTAYTVNFPVETTCDVLVVGGGGGGGHNGGGGGGGDVLYFQNVDIPSGTYNIKVGKGGTSSGNANDSTTTHGVKSEFYNIIAGGGGKGLSFSYYDDFISIIPPAETYTNPLTGLTATSQGASGGVRVNVSGMSSATKGGDGAGGPADQVYNNTATDGGHGIYADISGINIGYGGGGGGRDVSAPEQHGYGVDGGATTANIDTIGNKAFPGRGGGGASENPDGGSGIVIIRYKLQYETVTDQIIGGYLNYDLDTQIWNVKDKIDYKDIIPPYIKYNIPTITPTVISEKIDNEYSTLQFTRDENTYPNIDVDSTNLVAWYKFDGDLINSVTNTTVGALVETETAAQFIDTYGDYVIGKSALVNNTILNIPDFNFSNLTEGSTKSFTVSFWFKVSTLSDEWNILFDASNYQSFTSGIRVYINSNKYLYMYYYNTSNNNTYRYSLNGDFADNNWRLYTFVYTYKSLYNNNSDIYIYDLSFYENGVLNNKINVNGTTNSGVDEQIIKLDNANGFQIGHGDQISSVYAYPMEGYYDDFRIYNKALSQDEITDLYTQYSQTQYKLTFDNPALCDILMIGGGGGGATDRAGGGGAGSLLFYKNFVMKGSYKIKVGKGGKGGGNTSGDYDGYYGYDSEISSINNNPIFKVIGGGGGGSISTNGKVGGCGGGAGSQSGTVIGGNTSFNYIINSDLAPNAPNVETDDYVYYANIGGRNIHTWTSNNLGELDGAGGGGIGEGGTLTGLINSVDAQQYDGGKGGDGKYKATINNTDYVFKDYFNLDGTLEEDGFYYIGGGGGGGDHHGDGTTGVGGNGGKGGGGYGGTYRNNGGNASGYGSGGGGGAGRGSDPVFQGGKGSDGIIVIRYKTILSDALDGYFKYVNNEWKIENKIDYQSLKVPEQNSLISIPTINPLITPITLNDEYDTIAFTYSNYPILNKDYTNLVIWYKFDDKYNIGQDYNYLDTKYNLSNSNVTLVQKGLINSSALFDGTSDLLSSNTINFTETFKQNFTISFWANVNSSTAQWGQIMHISDDNGGSGFYIRRANANRIEFWLTSNATQNRLFTLTSPDYTVDIWRHYAVTYNNTEAKLYIDSVLHQTVAVTLENTLGNGNIRLGDRINNDQQFYGQLDDFRFYDINLTEPEIQSLYNINENQTYYNLTFDNDTECDILIVGGGGSGGAGETGTGAGGGGGGQVQVIRNFTAKKNTPYNILVGRGGEGKMNQVYTNGVGNIGNDTIFYTYKSLGGGGGGLRDIDATATYTGGGAGGYGGLAGDGTHYDGGLAGSTNTGGGGGAGSGGNGLDFDGYNGGNGGIGVDRDPNDLDYIFIDNFGQSYGYLEHGTTWFGGGGGGTASDDYEGSDGIGRHGGTRGNSVNRIGLDAKWGGGSGGVNGNRVTNNEDPVDLDNDGTPDLKAGNGGDGIVIVKYKKYKKQSIDGYLKYDITTDKWIVDNEIDYNKFKLPPIINNTDITPNDTYNFERQYPPVRNLASDNHSIKGEEYANGYYITKQSSLYVNNPVYGTYRLFNDTINTLFITELPSTYNYDTSGTFIGHYSIDGLYKGEWAIIEMPVKIKLTRYKFYTRNNTTYHVRAPASYKIYGSNDGSDWTEILERNISINQYDQTMTGYSNVKIFEEIIENPLDKTFNQFALVINKITGNGSMVDFENWDIFGCEILKPVEYYTSPEHYASQITNMDGWMKIKHLPARPAGSSWYSGNTFEPNNINDTYTIGDYNDDSAEWAREFNGSQAQYFLFVTRDSHYDNNFKDRFIVLEKSEITKFSDYNSTYGYNYASVYVHHYKSSIKPNGFVAKTSQYYENTDFIMYNRGGTHTYDPNIGLWHSREYGSYTQESPYTGGHGVFLEDGTVGWSGAPPVICEVFVKYTPDIVHILTPITQNYVTFLHSNTEETQTQFKFELTETTVADILIVAGGGAGGASVGGGGGAGGVIYQKDVILKSGIYNIFVGKGGEATTTSGSEPNVTSVNNGYNSKIMYNDVVLSHNNLYLEALGGGGGGSRIGDPPNNYDSGFDGGSGGGGSLTGGGVPVDGGNSLQGNTIYIDLTNQQGGYNGGTSSITWFAAGGGGAGGFSDGNNGGEGILIDITGTNTYYAAGGGGGRLSTDPAGIGGSGIGGSGTRNTSTNGTLVVPAQLSGINGTGSGGGGGGYDYNYAGGPNGDGGGSGGSGIIIIKYKKEYEEISDGYLKYSNALSSWTIDNTFDYELIKKPDIVTTNGGVHATEPTYNVADNLLYQYNFEDELLYPSEYARKYYFDKIDGVSPDSYYVAGSTYDNGTYIVKYSSHESTTNWSPHYLFYKPEPETTDNTKAVNFADNQYSNGNYVGGNTLAGVSGDWVTIQMPHKIVLTKYIFVSQLYGSDFNYNSRLPHKYKIYGCNDGDENWQLIFEEELDSYGVPFTNTYVNPKDSYLKILSDSQRLTGYQTFNTYGLVVEKIGNWGGSTNITKLCMAEFELYGCKSKSEDYQDYKTLIFNYVENTTYPQISADATNLVAWYKFDGDFTDSSGNGNDLTTYQGTPVLSTEKYVLNQSVYLSSSSFLVNSFTLHNTAFAVSLWFYLDDNTGSNYNIISQRYADATNQNLHIRLNKSGSNISYTIAFWANDLTSQAYNDANKWIHVIFQLNESGNKEIWRNGELIASDITATFLNTNNANIIIGNWISDNKYFRGYFDDFRIYNKSLTQSEISDLYNNYYQKVYDVEFPEEVDADILIVGGGGSGGNSMGGGGGAGGVVYTVNQKLSGHYKIGVGKGGEGVILANADPGGTQGNDGYDSYIKNINNTDYITMNMGGQLQNLRAYGGGGGGAYYESGSHNLTGASGRQGGSGGGGSDGLSNNATIVTYGGTSIQPNTLWNGSQYLQGGSDGNNNYITSSNTNPYFQGGGGGGVGGITPINNSSGKTGILLDISGIPRYYAGGGGGGQYGTNTEFDSNWGLGGNNVGGNGRIFDYENSLYKRLPQDGVNGTGSGGGGGAFTQDPDLASGAGGNGVVIIRYLSKKTIKNNYLSYNFETSKWSTSLLNANDIFIGTLNQNVLPIATTNTLGCIKVDNSTINIDEYGILSSTYNDTNVSNYLLNLDTHIIPDTDNAYDIGSVDKRIRELFVSNNSIWMGDTHKIVIKDNKMKFKKINKNVIPTRLQSISGVNDTDIFSFFNNTVSTKEDITLSQWLEYGKSKDSNIDTINDVFEDDDNNFEQEISTDIWQTHTNNIILHSDYQNIGIGTTTPGEKLHIIGNTKIEGTLTTNNLNVIGSTTTINTQTYTSENLLIDNTDGDGESIKIYHKNANHDIVSIYTNDTNSSQVFTIAKTGFIGISHDSPDFPLHIQSSSGKGIRVDCDDTDVEILRFTPNDTYPTSYGGALKYHGTGSNYTNKFSITMDNVTNTNIEALSILQNGNIGIGIINPTDKLEVNGSHTIVHTSDTTGGGGLYFAHVTDNRTWNLRMGATGKNLYLDTYTTSWQTRISYLTNGNVGIGIVTPLAKLHIHSASQGDGILISQDNAILGKNSSNAKSQLMFWNGTQVYYGRVGNDSTLGVTAHNFRTLGNSNSTVLRIVDDKVGIGTESPTDKLTVYDGRIKIHQNSSADNAVIHLLANTYNTYLFTDRTSGSFHIRSHSNNDVIIDSNGSVGVGTTPSSKLHVHAPSNNSGIRLSTNSQAYYLYNSDSTNSGGAGFSIQNITDSKIPFRIKGTGEILLSPFDTKNVGIGTSSPSGLLHIAKTSIDNSIQDQLILECHTNASDKGNAILFKNRWNNGAYWDMARIKAIEEPGYGGALIFETNNGSGSGDITTVEAMRIDEFGNIGIGGVTVPEQKIDMRGSNTRIQIYGNSNTDVAGLRISANNNSGSAPILYLYANGTGSCCEINSRTNHSIKFLSNNVERMIITNDGKVGIGTMSPGYKLEISGDINISGGDFYKDGVLFTGGGGSTVWQTNNNDIYYDLGNVGIGTLTPAYTLDVIDNVSTVRIKSDIASGQGHSVLLIDSKNTGEAAIKLATNSQETWKLSSGTSSQLVNNSILVDNAVVNSVYNIDYQKIILSNNGSNQQSYQVNFQNDMKIDILIVGGGGGGYGSAANNHVGGGGGGGAILYATDLQVTSGTYTFKVGRGGGGELAGGISAEDGFASEAFGAIANGGSKGKRAANITSWYGGAGGTTDTLNTTVVFTEYNGGDGGTGTYTTDTAAYPLYGANGPLIDIVGPYYWGGGGGGGGWYGNFGSGGQGGGAGGGFYNNGYYGPATGGTGINSGGTNFGGYSGNNPVAGSDGGALTGGGGGGAFRHDGGSGGSGSIIIVYKTTDIIYTPDTNLRLYNSLASSIFSINQNGNLDVTGDINFNGDLYKNNSLFSSYSDTNFDARFNTRIAEGLQITGTANNVNTVVSANLGTYGNHAFLDLRTNSNSGGWIDFGSLAGEDFKVRIRGHNEPRKIEFYTSQNVNPEMYLDTYGDLYVNGNITAYYSDERLKTVTENVKDVLNTLNNVDVFKYKRNDLAESLGIKHTKQEIGLSAQQINKYYPEVVSIAPFDIKYDEKLEKNVSKSGENYLTLNYERLVPILLQGIKELNNKNIKLENQLKDMKQDIEDIKKYINK
jgi:hypothetical protein